MHDEFDNFENDVNDLVEDDNFNECTDCPYLMRQLPFQPYTPPQQQHQHQQPPYQQQDQYPGGYGRPPFGYPPGPPPSRVPFKANQISPMAVSPGSIRPCMHRFVYIWLENGRSFWAWLTRVDRRTASGFRWNGRRWVYFGVDLRRIDQFECF